MSPALGSSGGAGLRPAGGAGLRAPGSGGLRPAGRPAHRSAPARKAQRASGNPFAGRGMWIWVLSSSSGGSIASIAGVAHLYGISTLMIKSGDGTSMWSQFNPGVVSALHANGLRVCAWQYVYGASPIAEARVGAAAVRDGADCLLIDAESEYEGRYVQAQAYIRKLRQLIGWNFPVALAGFPYIDFHPAFPYSVFLGPGGAQYNVPQMYWRDIGTSVDAVYAHTYLYNRLYKRPISPLGEVSNSPPARQVIRFRQLSRAYGPRGISWWDWQESRQSEWRSLSQPIGSLADYAADPFVATIKKGALGDLVVWAQEHLITAGDRVGVDGGFGPKTLAAVKNFQLAHGLPVDGIIGPETWQALLRYPTARITWGAVRKSARTASAASASGVTPVPKSASLPAKRNELAGSGGAGRPGQG